MTASNSLFRVRRNCREKRARSSGACVLAREAHRQDLAALLAAAAEYFASPLGFHARAESVRANAALVPRTVCWLTHASNSEIRARDEDSYNSVSCQLSVTEKNRKPSQQLEL